ncbi:histidine kinase [Proteinivorax tanatarense]|uniref:histidine kinase n=1 Tax=Proteinivorax tanatarense TaxID=1260629 RepID=A0AAU7VPL1_9FIRM
MKSLYLKLIYLIFVIVNLITYQKLSYLDVIITLLLLIIILYRDKFSKYNKAALVGQVIIIIFASILNPVYSPLLALGLYEVFFNRLEIFALPILAVTLTLELEFLVWSVFLLLISWYFGKTSRALYDSKVSLKEAYDKERKLRYSLEKAKQNLLESNNQTVYLAGLKERNRIAVRLHDELGHCIAGQLFQLQAIKKVFKREEDKAEKMLEDCIEKMRSSLELLRTTVHDLKPKEDINIGFVDNLINNFNFCKIRYNKQGDFNQISSSHLGIIYFNIKEALTNVVKHSNATEVEISINSNQKFTRVFVKDNGRGCQGNIKENLGLSSIKERVKYAGGTISISSEKGFLMVFLLPQNSKEGDVLFESVNS